ncbi:MAG: phage major capsid protein [Novosphingobium sp.]
MRHVDKTALLASATMIRKGEEDDPVSIVTKSLEDLQKTVDERLKKVEEKQAPDLSKLTERLDKIEAKGNRPKAGKADPEEGAEIEAKAFNQFLRTGQVDAELKTMTAGTPADGGYTVAPEYSATVIEGITEFSPIRQLASVMSISTSKVYIPVMTTPLNGGWVTETGDRDEDEPKFDQEDIDVYEQAVIVPISRQLLEDSMIDLQGYLAGQVARQFGKQEGNAFVRGNGSGKPTGFLHDPNLFEKVTAKMDGSDIIEKIIKLFYSLPSAYAARGSWLMTRELQGIIRAAADNTTKGTLWSDSLANGTPAMLLGRPVYEAPDMQGMTDGGSPAGSSYPVAFADWSSMYQIVDRIGLNIMRDDYTGAGKGIVKFYARRRVGGKVVLPEAGVLLKTTETGT